MQLTKTEEQETVTSGLQTQRDLFPYAMLAPAVIVLLAATLFPFAYAFWTSLHYYSLANPQGVRFIGVDNYVNALQDELLWLSLGNSVIYTVTVVVVQSLLGLGTAILVNREIRGKGLVRTLLMLPMVMTPVAAALMWRVMYNPQFGILDYLLGLLGIPPVEWVSSPTTAMPALMLVDTWQHTPFVFLVLLAGLMAQPLDVLEAAEVDGAGRWQKFWYVTLPHLRPVFGIVILFRTMDAFRTFDIIYSMTGGGPGHSTQTLNLFVFLEAFKFTNMGYACALGILLLIIIIVISQFLLRWSRIEIFE